MDWKIISSVNVRLKYGYGYRGLIGRKLWQFILTFLYRKCHWVSWLSPLSGVPYLVLLLVLSRTISLQQASELIWIRCSLVFIHCSPVFTCCELISRSHIEFLFTWFLCCTTDAFINGAPSISFYVAPFDVFF